ncbi:DNA methyltransferase [Paracoccus sp. S-4012]|uniref:DNA methyltransferase n=1 Tax=Paracoccus sp. S-4012 TaxID=2665648 RepID=UPI00351B7CA2
MRKPPPGRCWSRTEEQWLKIVADGLAYFGKNGDGAPAFKRYLQDDDGVVPTTWWPHDDAGHTDEASKESVKLFGSDISFDTPKPERLLQRILHIATNPGDLVLDSFLGSGTTAAVAHKMGRRWIGVEMGEHARTHCATRLRKVIEGEQGGISKDVGWQGGGAFRFVTLGPRVYDENGVIAPEVRFADLARHVWFTETRRPLDGVPETPLLGIVNRPPRTDAPDDGSGAPLRAPDRAVALLFNGILRDRSAQGGNVLTRATLSLIREHLPQGFAGTLTVYATASRLSAATLKREGVQFRQTPYDLNAGGR